MRNTHRSEYTDAKGPLERPLLHFSSVSLSNHIVENEADADRDLDDARTYLQ